MGMGQRTLIYWLFCLMFSLPSFAFVGGDDGGTDPLPWGDPCQFNVENFEGFWAARHISGQLDFYFRIEIKQSGRGQLLSVEQLKIDSEGQEPVARVTANGTGIFQNNGKQINAVMRSVTFENENSRTTNIYWLYFHSFCSPNSGEQTYLLKLKDTEALADDPDTYLLERVNSPELIEMFLNANEWHLKR